MIVKKLNAGALQFTMYVVVVIALVLGAFIILLHTHKHFKIQTNVSLEVIKNCDKGMLYATQNSDLLRDTLELNIFNETFKTVKIHKTHWGVFEKVTSVSKIKNKVLKKIALVGGRQLKTKRTALYLEDHNKPLVLVGNTKIQGLAYVPKQGIRTGNISGHSYYGNALIYGNTKFSGQLPQFSNSLKNEIEITPYKYKNAENTMFLDVQNSKKLENSFYNPIKLLYSSYAIELFDEAFTGNIVVQSGTKITVHSQSKLKDVLLIAPEIEVKHHVKGCFQAFATKKITVGKNCELTYPSALVLNNTDAYNHQKNKLDNPSFIELSKGSLVKGVVIFLGNDKNYHPQIIIQDKVKIYGEVFCNKNIELLGEIKGAVFTSGFVANQSGSMYQNHIYNGQIIVDNLSGEYVGLSFLNSKKGITKWLY